MLVRSFAALCALTIVAAAGSARAGVVGPTWTVTTDDALTPGTVIGSDIPNNNFVVGRNDSNHGIEVGIMSFERWFGNLPNTGNRYFSQPGESPISNAPGAPADPGKAKWNYFVSFYGGGLPMGIFELQLVLDFNPAVGNADFLTIPVNATPGFPAGAPVIQDTQNLGFGFWAATFPVPVVTNYMPFNPNTPGEYFMAARIRDSGTHAILAEATAFVEVLPAPGATALLGLGGLLAARRRR